MDELSDFARQIFRSQPFTRFIGAELDSVGLGTAAISLRVAEHHTQQHGFVHGGVISYLADNALTFAGGLALGGDALTSEFKINYVKPAAGTQLVARAQTKAVGKRQAVCQCEIWAVADGNETLCAIAQGTIIALK